MKKDVTIVPKDKCPLDILAEMGDRTKNAWVYLHVNAVYKLKETCNEYEEANRSIKLKWNATEEFPSTSITIGTEVVGSWRPVWFIEADDIAFKQESCDPEEIFFLEMEE